MLIQLSQATILEISNRLHQKINRLNPNKKKTSLLHRILVLKRLKRTLVRLKKLLENLKEAKRLSRRRKRRRRQPKVMMPISNRQQAKLDKMECSEQLKEQRKNLKNSQVLNLMSKRKMIKMRNLIMKYFLRVEIKTLVLSLKVVQMKKENRR